MSQTDTSAETKLNKALVPLASLRSPLGQPAVGCIGLAPVDVAAVSHQLCAYPPRLLVVTLTPAREASTTSALGQEPIPSPMTPQQKKALDYEKQRRNCYGENTAASRKGIRRRKRSGARDGRRKAAQTLGQIHETDCGLGDAEDLAMSRRPVQRWKKTPDQPLGQMSTQRLIRDIEAAVLRHSRQHPNLVSTTTRRLSELGWHPRAVEALARTLSAVVNSEGKTGSLDLSLAEAREVWTIIKDALQRRAIEPLARRRRQNPP